MTGIVIGTSYPAYEDEGPPPWAPAHGHRAKHQYHYYPYERVYFDPQQRVYFYLNGGRWQMSVSLPSTIRITVNEFVSLDMDSDRPYEHHNEVIKRYPPGQLKKKDDNRNKYKDDDNKKSRDNDKDKSQNNNKKNYSDNDSKKSVDTDKDKTKAKAKLKTYDKNKDEDDEDENKKDNKDDGRD